MYFSQLPDVYIGEGITDTESFKYRLVKNIFRRCKAREDLDQYTHSFEAYSISDDESPADISDVAFDSPYYDWVLLLCNNITDFYGQWPKNHQDLIDYVNATYTDPESVHHYETNEVLWNNIVLVKSGIQVNDNYRVLTPDGVTKTAAESRSPLTNYEWEYYLNEKKRQIQIPNSWMFELVTTEFENLVAYEPHSELDNFGHKKTPMNVAQRFLDVSGYVTGSISRSNEIGVVTSYDYGPSATTSTAGVATTTASETVNVY